MHYACVARHTVLPYFNGLLTIVSSKLHCIPLDYIGLPYTTYSVRYIYIYYIILFRVSAFQRTVSLFNAMQL